MFPSYSEIVTLEATVVSDYVGCFQARLSLQEINLEACTPLILTQIILHILELHAGCPGKLFNYRNCSCSWSISRVYYLSQLWEMLSRRVQVSDADVQGVTAEDATPATVACEAQRFAGWRSLRRHG